MLLAPGLGAVAQQSAAGRQVTTSTAEEETYTRGAWEIGLGALGTNWSRVTLSNFHANPDNYQLRLNARHLLGGAQLYVAHEITPWFYLDLQGSMSFAPVEKGEGINSDVADTKLHQLYLGGIGAQFRLTPLLQSSYVEPYLRLGVNYMYRDFYTAYSGKFKDDITQQGHWQMIDTWNSSRNGESYSKSSFPVSVGLGVKGWLSDHFGLGLQTEYLMPLASKNPHFFQASASLIWRIGGKSKKRATVTQYIELPPVEKVVEVEKIVTKEVPVVQDNSTELLRLLNAIYFEFDTDRFTQASIKTLDRLAQLINQDSEGRFLIIGMTDARGSQEYNIKLSNKRAKAVYEALLSRHVDPFRIKWVGVGKGSSVIPASGDNMTREGDRKVLIERITNYKYWNAIK